MTTAEIKINPFHKSAAAFQKHADRGTQHAIATGRMTQADADYIEEFVITLEAQAGIGEQRVYKIRNSLSNAIRFFKTPLTDNSIIEIYKVCPCNLFNGGFVPSFQDHVGNPAMPEGMWLYLPFNTGPLCYDIQLFFYCLI